MVDKAYHDLIAKRLELEERSMKANIDSCKLERVNDLLHDIMLVVKPLDEPNIEGDSVLYTKIVDSQKDAAKKQESLDETQRKFLHLRKKGRLGKSGKANFAWAQSNVVPLPPKCLPAKNQAQSAVLVDAVTNDQAEDTPVQFEGKECIEIQEWVQCVTCSKWRKIPSGVDSKSLPEDWSCDIVGNLTTGLNCLVSQDTSDANEECQEVADCHQPLNGGHRVKRVRVTLQPMEERISLEWGLRPCYTWGDGYCGYRCAAANRSTTMLQMLEHLFLFWGWKWAKKARAGQLTYKMCLPYKYVLPDETDICEVEYTDEMAKKNVEDLKPVHAALSSTRDILHKRHWCPDDIFITLAIIDNMCILYINTMAQPGEARYRVYSSTGCVTLRKMEDMSHLLRSAQEKGTPVRGVAIGHDHFCSLYPRNMQPNFAGSDAIGPFD